MTPPETKRIDTLFHRALAAVRAEQHKLGTLPNRGRVATIYAQARAPEGGWKSHILASRKVYLDGIEKRVQAKKVKYLRARDQIYTMLSQKDLDEIAELVHSEMKRTSKGHVGWKVIHPEGLYEYWLSDSGANETKLYRAPHHHVIDIDTHQRVSPSLVTTGLARAITELRRHGVELPPELAKKERKVLEDFVWKITHKDFKGGKGKERSVFHNGTQIWPLSKFSLEELRKKAGLTL